MNKLRAILTSAVIAAAAMSLAACEQSDEPNDIAYVVALGVDKGDGDDLLVTIQFANPSKISGGASEDGGEGGDVVENVSVSSPTVYSAIDAANQIISKRFSLAHTKLIVFSEEIAREGVQELIATLVRNEEVRPDAYLAVSLAGAEEYLAAVQPITEVNPAMYYQLLFENNQNSGVIMSTMQDFYNNTEGGIWDNVMPLANVTENTRSDSSSEEGSSQSSQGSSGGEGIMSGGESSQGSSGDSSSGSGGENSGESEDETTPAPVNEGEFEYKIHDYKAGEVARTDSNKSETAGMAIFEGDKMIASVGVIECKLLNMLRGKLSRGYISYYTEKSDLPVTVRVEQKRKPKITVDISGNQPNVKCKVYLAASFGSLTGDLVEEEEMSELKAEIESITEEALYNFLKKTSEEYGADIVGIGDRIRPKFLTYADMDAYSWQDNFPHCEYEVDVCFDFD